MLILQFCVSNLGDSRCRGRKAANRQILSYAAGAAVLASSGSPSGSAPAAASRPSGARAGATGDAQGSREKGNPSLFRARPRSTSPHSIWTRAGAGRLAAIWLQILGLAERGPSLFREAVAHDESVSLAYQEALGDHLRCYAGKSLSGVLLVDIACFTERKCESCVEGLEDVPHNLVLGRTHKTRCLHLVFKEDCSSEILGDGCGKCRIRRLGGFPSG